MTKKKHRLYKDVYQPKEGELLIMPRDERLLEASPYINTHKTLPDWFKNSSKQPGSIRRCAGTLDYLSLGATLPFWSNAYFSPNPNMRLKWNVEMENLPFGNFFSNEPFSFESTGKCPMTNVREIEDAGYPKLVNPFMVRTAPGWSTLILPPLFDPNPNYTVVPSIVHTDVYHTMNIVLNITTGNSFNIKYGTPIAHLIPIKRNKDFEKIVTGTTDDYLLSSGRGFGDSPLQPLPAIGTAAPYRRYVKVVDDRIKEDEEQPSFWSKFKKW